MISDQKDIASYQQNFEKYLIGLTFTLLAASIAVSDSALSVIPARIELVARLCLLLSGLTGLSRQEWIPVLFKMSVRNADIDEREYDQVHQKQMRKYALQKWLFAAEVIAEVVARSWPILATAKVFVS